MGDLIMRYLCKWSSGEGKYLEWEDLTINGLDFFSDANGYEDRHRLAINRLDIGESVDLSDGISQFHEVERIS